MDVSWSLSSAARLRPTRLHGADARQSPADRTQPLAHADASAESVSTCQGPGHHSLQGQLVAFCLVFDWPEHDPGLTVDRIWVTRGGAAEPRVPG